jgi:hypothetical protein
MEGGNLGRVSTVVVSSKFCGRVAVELGAWIVEMLSDAGLRLLALDDNSKRHIMIYLIFGYLQDNEVGGTSGKPSEC